MCSSPSPLGIGLIARALPRAEPILCVDTGMQRWACPPEQVDEVLRAGDQASV